ncbi:flagellar hook-associated protein FlgK [Histidinibacterium aquaticum]|uniref:Flagellar hook-associated protein 1 n=1 Tax=Histidinibacterium aquaticum TaxID=2613962 RepID=A0A5J5GP79_9RHOB|nr:flagellar hook-associated protein FlgK [Histidinibacterium aquaticum]KAA9009970.1 flagellar hook-associated protein FlgK [Histidinibacterium aquaticum]
MSLTGALIASRSGLQAVSRWSETTAGNISNANTQGYVRRDVGFATQGGGSTSGVRVTGLSRESSAALAQMHREHLGMAATQSTVSALLEGYSAALGQPGDGTTLSDRLGALENSITALITDPGSGPRQREVLDAAQALTGTLNMLSDKLDDVSGAIRRDTTLEVERVNGIFGELAALNERINRMEPNTAAAAELRDRMDARLDALSQSMDFKVRERIDGGLDIFTQDGTAMVVGDRAETLEYDPVAGLSLGGIDVTPGAAPNRGISGGRLAGLMSLKDGTLPRFRLQLDEAARELVEGFSASDPTVAPGGVGLFTDAGAAYNPALREGLAGRIAVNDAVRPEAGGALWRLRDGIGAGAEGPAGGTATLESVLDGLALPGTYDPAAGLQDGVTVASFAAQLISDQQAVRSKAEGDLAGIRTASAAVAESRTQAEGVDIDSEMQRLLAIEQSYAANSKVLTTVARMIDDLLASI